jgi:hypothetical protein
MNNSASGQWWRHVPIERKQHIHLADKIPIFVKPSVKPENYGCSHFKKGNIRSYRIHQ